MFPVASSMCSRKSRLPRDALKGLACLVTKAVNNRQAVVKCRGQQFAATTARPFERTSGCLATEASMAANIVRSTG